MTRLIMFLLVPGLLFIAIACGDGDGDGDATPTSTVASADTPASTIAPDETPTPPADGETGGAEGFRQFIPTFQDALDVGDASFLRDRALTEAVVCTADDVAPAGIGGPACEFEGQEFDGFTEARWRSEGGIIPVENAFTAYDTMLANALPGESDDFGDGSVQVYALNIGEDRFDAIIAAIIERPFGVGDEEPRRVVYGTAWVFEGGRWMVQSTLTAFVLGEELLDEAQPVYPNWERYESP